MTLANEESADYPHFAALLANSDDECSGKGTLCQLSGSFPTSLPSLPTF